MLLYLGTLHLPIVLTERLLRYAKQLTSVRKVGRLLISYLPHLKYKMCSFTLYKYYITIFMFCKEENITWKSCGLPAGLLLRVVIMDRLHSPIEMRERGRRQLGYLPSQIITYPNCCAIMLRIPYVRQQVI